jgi:hypothetical protein
MGDPRPRTAERFDIPDQRHQPLRHGLGLLQLALAIIVSDSKRGDTAPAFVLAELERF